MRPFSLPPSIDDLTDMAAEGLRTMPAHLAAKVRGVSILVEEAPDQATLEELGLDSPWQLTGLYRGVPWGQQEAVSVRHAPDMIVLYRRPILLEWIETGEALPHLVRSVLVHEIAHHFGFSDADIEAIERGPG